MSALSGPVGCNTVVKTYNPAVRYAYVDGGQLFNSVTHEPICNISDLIVGDDYDYYGLEVRCQLYGYTLE